MNFQSHEEIPTFICGQCKRPKMRMGLVKFSNDKFNVLLKIPHKMAFWNEFGPKLYSSLVWSGA